jgi:uncharacterized integral membrane protein
MKALYLTGSIILTIFILVLAFGNISAECTSFYALFYPIETSTTLFALAMAAIGILTGAMYHAFMVRVLKHQEEDTQEEPAEKSE